MPVRIVTDSSADLPQDLAAELGVTVVPLYVRFGDEVFRERVTITDEEFYQRLLIGRVHPLTIQPSPQDFAEAYQRLLPDAGSIISIHISSKLSGTYNSAVLARDMLASQRPIEVIDSKTASIALGLIVTVAARAVHNGKSLEDVTSLVNEAIGTTRLLGLLDTLKYLLLGGRIGKARALVGSLLGVKPLLTLEDGEVIPAGQVRARSKGIERLFEFASGAQGIEAISVSYSTTLEEAQQLADRLKSFTNKPVKVFRMGTTLGVHTGPGSLMVAFRSQAT